MRGQRFAEPRGRSGRAAVVGSGALSGRMRSRGRAEQRFAARVEAAI
jgi:hypothetical protein